MLVPSLSDEKVYHWDNSGEESSYCQIAWPVDIWEIADDKGKGGRDQSIDCRKYEPASKGKKGRMKYEFALSRTSFALVLTI